MSESIPPSADECLYEKTFEDLGHGLDPRQLARRAATILIEHAPTPAEVVRRHAILRHFEQEYTALDPENTMLKAHQIDAIEGTYDFLMGDNPSDNGLTKRGLLAHAPGAGKSIYAAFLCYMLGVGKTLVPDQPPIRGLYLSNDVKGVTQTMGNDSIPRGFAKAAPWMDVAQLDVRTYSLRERMPTAPMVGMTYAALVARTKSHPEFFEGLDVIVADEAQFSMGEETLNILRTIMAGKLSFGLSGSAGKARRLFPERIHRMNFREGIEERGVLNSFVLMQFKTRQEIFGALHADGDYQAQSLRYARDNQLLRKHTEQIALTLAGHNYSTVIYAFPGDESAYAKDLAKSLDGQPVLDTETDISRPLRARAIGSFQSRSHNRQAFQDFDEKKLDVLVTTRMGEVAWDPEDLNAIILLCPSASFDTILQRLGRGARVSDKPTIVIHFDYEGPRQVTPYHVFGVEAQQGLVISNPKDEDNTEGQEWIKKIIDTKRKSREGKPLHDGEVVELHSTEDLQAENYDTPETTIDPSHPEYHVFKSILNVLETAELNLGKRRVFLRNGHESVTFEETTTAAVLADEYNIEERVLVRHFRRANHRFVSKDRDDGGRDIFCEAETTRKFIEEEIAKPNTYTTAQMAAMLGTSQGWVQNHLDQSEGESRYPRDSIAEQRAPYFPEKVFMRLLAEHEDNALPIRKSEISRIDLARRYDSDLLTVHKWFEKRGIRPVTRKVPPEPGSRSKSTSAICFPQKYEIEFAWAVSAAPLPKEGKYRTVAAAIEGSPVLRRMGHAQRVELMKQSGVQPKRYKRHTNTNYFISGAEYDAWRAVANVAKVVPDEIIAPSASAAVIIEAIDTAAFKRFQESKNMHVPVEEEEKESTRDPLPLKNEQLIENIAPMQASERQKFSPLRRITYRVNQGEAPLVRLGSHVFGSGIFRRDPQDGSIFIQEHVVTALQKIFLGRRRNRNQIPGSWPVITDIADTFNLDSRQIFQWVTEHPNSQQLHIVYTGKQPVIFCSIELVPFLLRNFKSRQTEEGATNED